jgi:signal transduction histidine kinase
MGRGPRFWERFLLAERSPLLRYGVAAMLAALSLLLVHLLRGLDRTESSSLALASVVLSAIYGGLGPALLDTGLTALGIDYLFNEPRYVVFDSWGSVVHIVVHGLVGALIANIVASLRSAYREAEAARRAREDILAVVSHDLRSPLSAILLGAEYLEHASEGKARGVAEGVERSGRQMGRLIDDLLDAVKIEKGQFRIQPGEHDAVPIVEDALMGVRVAAEAKAVRLAAALPAGSLPLRCDRGRLTQALANLLGNAVKFSPEGALVEVEVRESAGEMRFTVRDCGRGIAEEDLPHIFGRYWQAAATAHQGTGLGLFITRSIVEAHGGRIEVTSRPGQGSSFTLILPL